MFARSLRPGTALIIASMVTAPDVYPDCVPVAAAPAMVPPVARITTFGFLVCAEAIETLTADVTATKTARLLLRNFMMVLLCSKNPDSRLAGILALVELRELDRIEQVFDLRLGQKFFLTNDFENAFVALVGLGGKLGGLVVSKNRIEGRHDPYRGFHVAFEHAS